MDVDVVIPVRDGARFVRQCLDSVRAQTLPAKSVIVVDDGSTDDTARIVEACMGGWPELVLIRTEKRGLPQARNTGVARGRAPYLAFLDSDDIWMPTKLERQMELFAAAGSGVGFVNCAYYCIDDAGHRIEGRPVVEPRRRGDLFRDLLVEGNIVAGSGSAVVVRRAAFEEVGGFDEALTYAEDWDLWIRLSELTQLDFVPEALVAIRIHDRSMQHAEDARRRELHLFKTLLILDRWYRTSRFPAQLRAQYRQTLSYVAMQSLKHGWISGLRDAMRLLSELKSGDSRFGRELFAGRSDMIVTMLVTRISLTLSSRVRPVAGLRPLERG